ncbi:hypothetical protein GGR56DRAFT_676002 [Xylariaceae sp. FL0804]|nr:hypothetical protein GGR56DRAFT_676002 [Xylariaceae sp. FL0804]
MCWKPEYLFSQCGHRVAVDGSDESDASARRFCPGAEAYGHPCLGFMDSPARDTTVVADVPCPECRYPRSSSSSKKADGPSKLKRFFKSRASLLPSC